MEKLKILVAEHSVLKRKFITEAVNAINYSTVLHTASNEQIAAEWLKQCDIDVMLLDFHLVKENANEYIKTIKSEYPNTEIVIMSDQNIESAGMTLESLIGDVLYLILQPIEKDMDKWGGAIKSKLDAILSQIKVKEYPTKNSGITDKGTRSGKLDAINMVQSHQSKKNWNDADLVLIASSTGGPVALETICRQLPVDFNKPILVIQHMPPEFTSTLAETLDKKYPHKVKEGKAGDIVKGGQIIIAPGGFHMIVTNRDEKEIKIKLMETHYVNGVRPSADVLFHSVAKVYKGKKVLVVVLTGMGSDGTKGIVELKEACSCYCITQSEATCVVYGMPKCVFDAGLSDEAVDLNDIAFRIYQIAHSRG